MTLSTGQSSAPRGNLGTFAGLLIGMGGYGLARYAGVPLQTALAAVFALSLAAAIGYPIGLLVGHFISCDSDVDTPGFRVIAWANLLAWIVPAVGMALSAMTWLFYRRSEENRALYWWLSLAGGLLALASAVIGGGIAANQRTIDRCPFAAREHWSHAEAEICFGQKPRAGQI